MTLPICLFYPNRWFEPFISSIFAQSPRFSAHPGRGIGNFLGDCGNVQHCSRHYVDNRRGFAGLVRLRLRLRLLGLWLWLRLLELRLLRLRLLWLLGLWLRLGLRLRLWLWLLPQLLRLWLLELWLLRLL